MTTEEINKNSNLLLFNKLLERARQLANRNRKYTARIDAIEIIYKDGDIPGTLLTLCKKDQKYYNLKNVPRFTNEDELAEEIHELNANFTARGLDYPFRTLTEYIDLDLI